MENSTDMDYPNVTFPDFSTDPPNLQEIIDGAIQSYASTEYGNYYKINFPITFVVCLIGLVTNSFNIRVFSSKSMMNSANLLLLSLSVADIAVILTQMPYQLHYFFNFKLMFEYIWIQFYIVLIFVEQISIMFCNWIAVTVGIWRLIAIKNPLKVGHYCTMSRCKAVLGVIALLTLAMSCPVFAIMSYEEVQFYSRKLYAKSFSQLATDNPNSMLAYWALLSLINLVPCVILVILTTLLIESLVRLRIERRKSFVSNDKKQFSSQESQNYRITIMLTVLLVLFVLNNLPDSVLVLTAVFTNGDSSSHRASKDATDILRVFSMVNNSFTFFIYYFMGVNFRSAFKQLFCQRSKCFDNGESLSSGIIRSSRASVLTTVNSLTDIPAEVSSQKSNVPYQNITEV